MVNDKSQGSECCTGSRAFKLKPSLMALAVAQAILGAPVVHSETINLGSGCTLRDAVTAANTDTITGSCAAGSGADVINLEPGGTSVILDRYEATPNGLPIITSTITINGGGGSIIRELENVEEFRLMEVSGALANLTLNSLTLSGGRALSGPFPNFHGGGVYVNNSASLIGNDIVVDDNKGTNGGGINITGGTLELNGSVVSGNEASSIGGGIYIAYGDLTLTETEISDNKSRRDGGGMAVLSSEMNGDSITIYQNSTGNSTTSSSGGGIWAFYNTNVTISNSTIEANTATRSGGALFGDFQTVMTITDTQVSLNTSTTSGGGLYAKRSNTINFSGGMISDNSTGFSGGAFYARYASSVTLESTTVSGNSAGAGQSQRFGGGASLSEEATLVSNDVAWMSNYSSNGGAIATRNGTSGANIEINNSTFMSNSAAAKGGALGISFDSDTTISQSTFSENHAEEEGGAISNLVGSRMTIKNSTISNNSAGGGAGIASGSELTLFNSTVSANTAENYGGGLAASDANATLINSTIVANNVLGAQGGGGVRAFNSGYVTLRNCIVSGNSAPSGAEISASLISLVSADASNLLGSSATTTADAFDLFEPGVTDIIASSDSPTGSFALVSIVAPLADAGGFTLTHALPANSPAIDNGNPGTCNTDMVTTDQRGTDRDEVCDIGAFEAVEDSSFFVVPLPSGRVVTFSL